MSPSNIKYKSFLNPLLWLILFLIQCNEVAEKNSQIFKYNQANGIASLDPAFAKDQATTWACNQLYDGLVRLDSKMQVIPAIADSWTISNNALDYTFYLNKEVFFHENICFENQKNRRVNSFDFQYSFLRLLDPNVASPGAWIFKDRLNLKNPFTIIDSFQFIILFIIIQISVS